MLYMKIVKREILRVLITRKKIFSVSLILSLYEMWMATKLIVVIFFVTYLSQIIMMDTLNLHRSVCQLPLNKARRTKK